MPAKVTFSLTLDQTNLVVRSLETEAARLREEARHEQHAAKHQLRADSLRLGDIIATLKG